MADTVVTAPEAPPQRVPRRTRRGLNERREGWIALLFLLPNALGFLVFSVLAIVAAFVLSFFDWDLLLGAKFNGIANYIQLLSDDVF
ncbi:MAG: sugar ABC transporter permease, partial [Ktedonobacteraceae bacterium]|nr:sugar ABC transporter permease [Ktedonobacteraceae bacterium]